MGSIIAVDTISCDPLYKKIFGFKKSIGTCYNRIKRRVKQIFNSEMENMFEEASCQTAIESQSRASGCVCVRANERERERDRKRDRHRERERERENESRRRKDEK